MDIKTKVLVSKFKNISYFTDLEDYISDRVNENKLNYDKLKYLYDNLYKGRSEFIKQNIYPVGEFLSNGYSFEECEKITDLLDDATGKTIFFYDKKEQGHKFNKLFVDLKFSFDKYNEFIKCGNSKDIAFEIQYSDRGEHDSYDKKCCDFQFLSSCRYVSECYLDDSYKL